MTDDFCPKCNRVVPVWFRYRRTSLKEVPIPATFEEEYVICQFCGKEVYDSKAHDRNASIRARAIYEAQHRFIKGELNER